MTDPATQDPEHDRPAAGGGSPGAPPEPGRGLAGAFGPMTGARILALVLAVAFLAGAVGWAVGSRPDDPLSDTDVGFLQDMGYHHAQAVELSLILLAKDEVDRDLKHFAQEIVISQQAERGIFNATLDRFGHASDPGETAMAWMGGPGVPVDDMEGLATEEQLAALRAASGEEAAALWIALISEHHLGGMHMGDWAARHGSDRTTRNIARAMVRVQRGEVLDLARYRRTHDLPIPEGFTDPRSDQRLNALSLAEGG